MSKVNTVIDIVENALGEKLTESLLLKPQKIDLKNRQRIAKLYREYEKRQDFKVPEAGPYEIFPYVHPGWTIAHEVGGFYTDLSGTDNLLNVENNIKKLLLFYDRIALPSGFEYFNDYYRISDEEPLPEVANGFINHLKLYAKFRELISRGIVFFVPEVPTFFPARDAVEKIILPDEIKNNLKNELGLTSIYEIRKVIEQSLWIGDRFKFDLFIPGKESISFFDAYSRMILHQNPTTNKLFEASAGNLILDCNLPTIDKLSLNDIISIRSDSDAFKSWRASLRLVLQRSYEDLLKDSFNPNELRRLADEEFASARLAIETEIKKSSVLTLGKTGVRSVGIGLMAGVVTATIVANPFMVLASSAASSGITFLWDYIGSKLNKSKNMKNTALKAHYALWNSK